MMRGTMKSPSICWMTQNPTATMSAFSQPL